MRATNIIRGVSCAFLLSLAAAGTNETVKLQGRVQSVRGSGTNLVFKAESGAQYALKRTPASEALFLDTNLYSRVLVVSGTVRDKTLEITSNLRSMKNGKLHELFYYCDICSISSSAPGLCPCCREPSELREGPAK
jgi:hypothetical protein